MRLEELDKNFGPQKFNRDDVVFYDIRKEPFVIYGFYHPQTEEVFRRMPKEAAAGVSQGVAELAECGAGGRVRFQTDSPFVAIHANTPDPYISDNGSMMSKTFALYLNHGAESTFYRTFRYNAEKHLQGEGITGFVDMPEEEGNTVRDITIYFPAYVKVTDVYIGLQEGAKLLTGNRYRQEKPVVFYGSSITQGGCASHAGNCYEDFLSRWFDFDYINLGFSGNAKGEDAMAEYLAGLDMSMFVYDYDHNAPTFEHLEKTHDRFFRIVRAAHPDIPIIFMSAPDFDGTPKAKAKRRNLIFANYMRAFAEGDHNVYFVDGERMFGMEGRDACTVDSCHPNDLGMFRMAEAVGATMKGILQKQK